MRIVRASALIVSVITILCIGQCDAYDASCAYDDNGNLTQVSSSVASGVVFGYDGLDRLASLASEGSGTTEVCRDDARGTVEYRDSQGASVYSSDWLGRLQSVTSPAGDTVKYAYDPEGRVTKIEYPDRSHATYRYNGDGRIVSAKLSDGPWVEYDWGVESDLLNGCRYGNGWETRYRYNDSGQVVSVEHVDADGLVQIGFAYEYSDGGRCIHRTAKGCSQPSEVAYCYDAAGQLTEARWPDGYFERYDYDGLGNRVVKQTAKGQVNYTYDQSNQIATAGEAAYSFDSRGNLIARETQSDYLTFEFDGLRRLSAIHGGCGDTVFQYSVAGQLTSVAVGDEVVRYVYDETSPIPCRLAECCDGKSWTKNLHALNLVCQVAKDQATYCLYDRPNGNIVGLVDATGRMTGDCEYTPFGEVKQSRGERMPLGSVGGLRVGDLDILLIGARFYEPSTGRFLSRDPVAARPSAPLSWNSYVYAKNDPVNYVDPLGLDALIVYVVPRGVAPLVNPDASPTPNPKLKIRHYTGHTYIEVQQDGKPPVFWGNSLEGRGPTDHSTYRFAAYAERFPFYIPDGQGAEIIRKVESIKGYDFFNDKECADLTTLAIDTVGMPHPSFRTFKRRDPQKIGKWCRWCEANALAFNTKDYGGVCLSAIADIDISLDGLQGVIFDPVTGQLVLVGDRNVHTPPMDLEDFTVAVQSVFGLGDKPPENPGVSIGTEESDKPGYHKVRYDGMTKNTRFGSVLFEADRLLKGILEGRDNISGTPLRPHVPGYKTVLERLQAVFIIPSNDYPKDWSFNDVIWLEPDKVELGMSEDSNSLIFSEVKMKANTKHRSGDNTLLKTVLDQMADHLTDHYDEYASEFPVFEEVKTLGKLTGIVKWIRDNRVPFDFLKFKDQEISFVSTPEYTKASLIPCRTHIIPADRAQAMLSGLRGPPGTTDPFWFADTLSFTLRGGISLKLTDENTVTHQSRQATAFGKKALAYRENENIFSWDVGSGAGRKLRAVAAPVARTPKDGNVKLVETDIRCPVRGDLDFSLTRTYNSFDDRAGELGIGWSIRPAALRFPLYKVNIFCEEIEGSFNRVEWYPSVNHIEDGIEEVLDCRGPQKGSSTLLYSNSSGTKVLQYEEGGGIEVTTPAGKSWFGALGEVLRREDSQGVGIDYLYEENRLSKIRHDSGVEIDIFYEEGKPYKAVGPGGREVLFVMDVDGRLELVIDQEGQTSRYGYDQFARLLCAYDGNDQLLFRTEYDVYNRAVLWEQGGDVSGQAEYSLVNGFTRFVPEAGSQSEQEYDDQGRLVAVHREGQEILRYDYGTGLAPTRVIDAKGHVTVYERDLQDRPTASTDPCGNHRLFDYAQDGNLIRLVDERGTETVLERDEFGRVTRVQLFGPAGESMVYRGYTYDPATGGTLSSTDAVGGTTSFEYDSAAQVTRVTYPSGYSVSYTYDDRNRLIRAENGAGIGSSYEYDLVDRIKSVTQCGQRQEFIYDNAGNVIEKVRGQSRMRYEYGHGGLLVVVVDVLGNRTEYDYTPNGLLIGVYLPNGTQIIRDYNSCGRMTYEGAEPLAFRPAA